MIRTASRVASAIAACSLLAGCGAAVGAVLAAGDLREGFAGLQELVGFTRTLPSTETEISAELANPLAGTFRGMQLLGEDTVRFYIRTSARPTASIVDEEGNVTGYALPAIMAASLDSIEAGADLPPARFDTRRGGRAIFFVEGTQPPTPGARALYPGAFLGQLVRGESAEADSQAAALQALQIDLQAPSIGDLAGRRIPHEQFASVAEGVFSVGGNGGVSYEQEYDLDDGRSFSLQFERISRTTLPQ